MGQDAPRHRVTAFPSLFSALRALPACANPCRKPSPASVTVPSLPAALRLTHSPLPLPAFYLFNILSFSLSHSAGRKGNNGANIHQGRVKTPFKRPSAALPSQTCALFECVCVKRVPFRSMRVTATRMCVTPQLR